MGVWILDFMFATLKKHIPGRNRMFWRISRQNPSTALGCIELQEPPPQKKLTRFGVQSHACAETKRLGGSWRTVRRCRGPRRNHLCRFVLRSLTGFGRGRGQILGFFIDLLRRPYNTLALLSHYRASVWYLLSFWENRIFASRSKMADLRHLGF